MCHQDHSEPGRRQYQKVCKTSSVSGVASPRIASDHCWSQPATAIDTLALGGRPLRCRWNVTHSPDRGAATELNADLAPCRHMPPGTPGNPAVISDHAPGDPQNRLAGLSQDQVLLPVLVQASTYCSFVRDYRHHHRGQRLLTRWAVIAPISQALTRPDSASITEFSCARFPQHDHRLSCQLPLPCSETHGTVCTAA